MRITHHPGKTGLVAIAILYVVGTAQLGAVSLEVTRNDDPPPDGCMPSDCSLREAIIDANGNAAPDVVELPAGAYMLTIPGVDEFQSQTGDLNITDDLEIRGAGSDTTSIDGGDFDRIFSTSEGTLVTIQGLTLQNGDASSGGCVLTAGTLHLYEVVITSCTAFNSGGGLINLATGALTINDCQITGNSSFNGLGGGSGAGLFNIGVATMRDCTVSANIAEAAGGGIVNNLVSSELLIERSTISGNFANTNQLFFGGGGISNGGMLTVLESAITANQAPSSNGGGLNNLGGHSILVNVTISGNSAAAEGGAIWTGNGGVFLYNCTVVDNTSAVGSGIFDEAGTNTAAFATIIANNNGGNCSTPVFDVVCDEFPSLDSENSCGLCLVNTDPLLGPLADNGGPTQTHALLAGSPAIDGSIAGAIGAGCIDEVRGGGLAIDQRGVSRPFDGDGNEQAVCDIGAYEHCPGLGPECFAIFTDGFESGDTSAWTSSVP